LFGIADRLNLSASTEQGAPVRSPCTRGHRGLPVIFMGGGKFRLFGIADYLSHDASTEQGAPVRLPCTRALSVVLAESLPATAGDPHFAFGLSGPPQTRSQRGCDFRTHPCVLTRPCGFTRQ